MCLTKGAPKKPRTTKLTKGIPPYPLKGPCNETHGMTSYYTSTASSMGFYTIDQTAAGSTNTYWTTACTSSTGGF